MWEQIQANRRRSAIFLSIMVGALLVMGYFAGEAIAPRGGGLIGLAVALGIWAVQMMVYFTAAESILLGSANAHEIKHEDNPQLFNVVEEMKLASGLSFLPRIFVIDDPTPNAFAVGRKPGNSAIAVTTGLLQRLNRDELQGVIGHEMGHLKNRDVQFMMLAAVLLGSIVLLADGFWRLTYGLGRGSSRSRSRGGGGGQSQLILFLVALILMILAPLLAQLLYFACSRRREFLADASSAQFTRYPAGLASALEKIAGSQRGAGFANRTTAPMFIVNPLQAADSERTDWFATHPPTSMRVRILHTMVGAGLGDYEAAFRQARGGQGSVIGQSALQESAHQDARTASGEGEAGFALRDVRSMMNRLDGYIPVTCACGLTTRVPTTHESEQLRCVRCGKMLELPRAQVTPADQESLDKALGRQAPSEGPLEYQRTTSGWESFRCPCGQTLQLSPMFQGSHLDCNKCGRHIVIVPMAA